MKKLLVVGMDGLNWSGVVTANTPNLDGLAAAGALGQSLVQCPSVADSSSGPGWSDIATGVWPDKHGVRDNGFAGKQYGTYPDFLTRLEQANPAYRTYSAVDWAALHNQGTFGAAIDTRYTFDGDANGYASQDVKITTDAVDKLRNQNFDASFVYLGNTDAVAHASGTGSKYIAAIEKQDQQLGQLLAAIQGRPTYAAEDWLIIVTTDHGHRIPLGGHGGCGIDERGTWILAKGTGITPGARPIDTRQRGWSFTTDEFWSRTQSGQERENALRTRGVFAVADSDEFDDKSGGASFDSTLSSPPYQVNAGSTVRLQFVTHYRQEGNQTADVLVSFNGGADILVKRYSADARARVESLPVTVPPGASTMTVKFHYYNASNNWYWAIDDLRVL